MKNTVISPSDAIAANGPRNQPDAFRLQRQLSAPAGGKQWELIAAQLPKQLGIYASFNALLFEGSIVSLINTVDSSELLSISYTSDSLVITLPGNSPVSFQLPATTTDSPFHNIGIKLDGPLLIVILNCSILDFSVLESDIASLSLADVVVNVFESQAIVSS